MRELPNRSHTRELSHMRELPYRSNMQELPYTVLSFPKGTLARNRDPENRFAVNFEKGTRVSWISLFLGS